MQLTINIESLRLLYNVSYLLKYLICEMCGKAFDPIATRWQCPKCHHKMSCCEGEPQ